MHLTRWDPVRDLMAISDRLSRIADGSQTRFTQDDSYGAWVPPVDIFERNETLVLRVELPGVEKDDIEVRVENGVLALHGQRRRDPDVDEKRAYRLERAYGPFSRSFSLPTIVDSSKILATYKDGVLELTLPKAEEAKPKRVPIQTA